MVAHNNTKRPLFVAPPRFRADGSPVLKRLLIANRGEIACRIIRTCQQQLITTVAVYTDEDESSLHVQLADEAICIGPADQQPYQDIKNLIQVAKQAHVDAVHPGYGYLSENAEYAKAVADAGLVFVGPTPENISKLGNKRDAKELLRKHTSVPLIPGYGGWDQDPAHLEAEADRIGYPILIKASAGGGGKGMRVVNKKQEFKEAFMRCSSEAERSFGSGHCLIEKYIERGKHVEIQILGDGEKVISLLDRECSIQRRHQKIIEESPCPWLSPELRQRISESAIEIAQLLRYVSAGTVEFIVDVTQGTFYFLEVNTRIQVEHPITEEVVDIDIVALQLFIAAGGKLNSLPELSAIHQYGHAIEVRLCAENPFNSFLPCTGVVTMFKQASEVLGRELPHVRYELGVGSGSTVSVHFDSMISKIVVWSTDRVSAIQKMIYVLRNTICLGLTTNQLFLLRILSHPDFQDLAYTTSFIESHLESLLKPISIDYAGGSMVMAAVLSSSLFASAAKARPSAFANIRVGFRNQPKDGKTSSRKFVSCQLQALGHENAVEFMVTQTAADGYEIAALDPDFTLTPDQKRTLFNKQGGVLTRRFYHAMTSAPQSNLEARLTHANTSTSPTGDIRSGEIRLRLDNEQHSFFVSQLSNDEFKSEICVYSTHTGCSAVYSVLTPLSWGGKFEERWTRGGLGSSDTQRKYLSPMPCHILQILAKDGSQVERGDGLLVMESMKTEIRINAEAPGIVRMHVQQGAKISEGVIMCEVTALEDAET